MLCHVHTHEALKMRFHTVSIIKNILSVLKIRSLFAF